MSEFNLLQSLPSIAPEIGLTIIAIVVVFLDSYLPKMRHRTRNIAYVTTFSMVLVAITPFIWAPGNESVLWWGDMIRHDTFGQIFKVMIILGGAVSCLIATEDEEVGRRGEYQLIIVIATLGGCLMAVAADLIMVFVALETISIPLYILAAFARDREQSSESGLKYFLFGSFASAIMLYGLSLLYGFVGTTNLTLIADGLASGVLGSNIAALLLAFLFVLVGFGFKISAVPFHFWTPDVYEGAPTPVVAFVSVASKAASFALLTSFLLTVFPDAIVISGVSVESFWVTVIAIISAVTMTFGNVLALRQSNIKRLLAYSSIAQGGYVLIGVASLHADGNYAVSSIAFYLFMYTFSNLLMFAGVILFSNAAGSTEIRDMAGIQRRSPWLAVAMTIALLSLSGIPPAAGFIGKFLLFQAAVDAGLVWLAIVGVLNAIIALYYYLVVIKIMWVDKGENEDRAIVISPAYAWALGVTTIIVLLLGIVPAPVINWAIDGADAFNRALTTLMSTGF